MPANQPRWPGEERLRSTCRPPGDRAAATSGGGLEDRRGSLRDHGARAVQSPAFKPELKGQGSFHRVSRASGTGLEIAADGWPTWVQSDKHGGRHYYMEPLNEAFPDAWIDRGPEGPDLSRYRSAVRANRSA